MRVAIAGGHGQIGQRLIRLLAARGDQPISLDRNPDHGPDIREAGGEPVVCDLETAAPDEVAEALGDADVVVFAAGAGPGSGPERKWTMDLGGAVKLAEAAKARGISRYVMVSAISADPDAPGDDTFAIYLRAKGKADADLAGAGLDHTIVRPGRLTDEPGEGRMASGDEDPHPEISRDDVAATLAEVLGADNTIGKTFSVLGGETPIRDAVAAL
jgi:uncharacterized protein YbjT (DUF2867 family)